MQGLEPTPQKTGYDVVIIGGAIMGASTAWWLTELGFDGRILVVERDPTYAACSTAHTNSCMRQQFSTALNIKISQFAAEFIGGLSQHMQDDRAPDLRVQSYGYMYLADTESFAETLRRNSVIQHQAGVPTKLMTPDEIAEAYPFYALDDIFLGSINTQNEGYWDGGTVFDWWRRSSRQRGVEFVASEVVGFAKTENAGLISHVLLSSGERIACGLVVNATGPRAARTAEMAGLTLPVEPRKRFSWVFKVERALDRDLPLTIDPSGVHVRQDGPDTYLAGSKGATDPAVDPNDFEMDHAFWEESVWPRLARRIPAFEALRVINAWAGHYAYNTLDQNAVIGPHPALDNFHFLNGFSGHGLQQSPAMGRGLAELIVYGGYRSLDLSPFHFDRILADRPLVEAAVI